MTTINRATWIDDDGSGMTGTILNNARLQGDIYDRVDGALATLDAKDVSQDTAIAANGPHGILSAQHTNTSPAALVAGDLLAADATGKLARLPAGTNGQLLGVTAGLPAWAPMNPLTILGGLAERGRPTPLGEWITPAFNAAAFSGSGAMTWTVAAGGVAVFQYTLIGRTCVLCFDVTGTTAGTPSTGLTIVMPAAAVANAFTPLWVPPAMGLGALNGLYLTVFKDGTLSGPFPIGSVRVAGTVTYAIGPGVLRNRGPEASPAADVNQPSDFTP